MSSDQMRIEALEEDLHRARVQIEALEREVALLYRAATECTRDNLRLRKKLNQLADDADREIELARKLREARRTEAEALEL